MTCKDCLSFEACELKSAMRIHLPTIANLNADYCKAFKDKSRFVELPCKVGAKFYAPIRGEIFEFECLGFVYGYGKTSLIEPSGRSFLLNK